MNSKVSENISKKQNYLMLLKEKNFLLEAIASIISRFGDGIDTIAFSLLVYYITGSTLLVATLYAVNGIPNILFGMVSGVVCKYVLDKRIMYICDFGRGLCVTLTAILFITGNLQVWHLYVITFFSSSFESFRAPASTAIVPKILTMEKIEYGMAFSSSGSRGAEILGLAVAPVIISFWGLAGGILVDAVTFFICGILVALIKMDINKLSSSKLTVKSYFKDLRDGFSYVKKDALILYLTCFAAVANMLFVPYNSLETPYIKEVFHGGSLALSIMSIGGLIGMIVAGILAPKIKSKIGNKNMFVLGGITAGLAYCCMAVLGELPIELGYFLLAANTFILGVGALMINFPLQIILMKGVPSEYLSRVASIINAVALCITPLTACIIGVITEFISLKALYIFFGLLVIMLFIVQLRNKNIQRLNEY